MHSLTLFGSDTDGRSQRETLVFKVEKNTLRELFHLSDVGQKQP